MWKLALAWVGRGWGAELKWAAKPLSSGAKGGGANLFSNLLNTVAPQQCESNYDCEAPLVCCDLIVASVCCSSGMMIGPPQRAVPQMQRQKLAIPVPVDDDNFPPRGGAYGPGNGFPSPP